MKGRVVIATPALAPTAVLAHASERAVILTLPTGPYIWGAGSAVAISAVVAAFSNRLPTPGQRRLIDRPLLLPEGAVSWLSAIGLGLLILVGLLGTRDPYENALPLMVWTVIWVGLTIAVALFGNLWTDLNPWTGPVRTLRSLLGRTGGMGLARFGHLPAVAGFFAFAWYEIVSLSPDDPAELAIVASVYWLLIFALAVGEGEDWLPKGEFFSAFFGFVGSMAPFWAKYEGRRVEVHAGVPGAQIISFPPLTKSAIAFVTLMLATVSFDGLHESFRWVAFLGLNPLDYPGRSAVTLPNTIGLFATWMLMSALIVGAILLTLRLARSDLPLSDIAGPWILSFLPIAAAYHIAHYLVALLTQGQYAIAALSDPLGTGADYLGLGPHWVSFGFLSQQHAVWTIWIVQFAIILGAHLLAVLLSEQIVRRAGLKLSLAAQAPIAFLMVLYTCFGLWLLAAPAIG